MLLYGKDIVYCAVVFKHFCKGRGGEVHFSPSKKCENALVERINATEKNIDVAVYSINNKSIVNALKQAHDRGIQIRILTDRLQAAGQSSSVRELRDYGLDIRVHSKNKIEHNKFAIFDGKKASTGSFNWTNPAADKNSENCVFFSDDDKVVNTYQDRFNYLWQINTAEKSEEWFNRKK